LDKMLARVLPETIRLELSNLPGDYWVKGDPTRLQQVFMNLALNARDAMPEGGVLRFDLSQWELRPQDTPIIPDMPPGKWVRIIVSDTGAGISSEVREHIFEPFFTTKPVGEGTGLGLAQVYGIVKQHDGYIDVHSQIGEGTTFIIYLPALKVARETEKISLASDAFRGRGQTVLVVEDDPTTRQALQALLEAQNYNVLLASDGIEALQCIENTATPIELVISDIVMPEMGGVALYQTLQEQYPDLKMLFITGHPLDKESRILLEEGGVHWLQKPFSVQGFSQTVKGLLVDNN
jgi:CheY-like chemotaxis protein